MSLSAMQREMQQNEINSRLEEFQTDLAKLLVKHGVRIKPCPDRFGAFHQIGASFHPRSFGFVTKRTPLVPMNNLLSEEMVKEDRRREIICQLTDPPHQLKTSESVEFFIRLLREYVESYGYEFRQLPNALVVADISEDCLAIKLSDQQWHSFGLDVRLATLLMTADRLEISLSNCSDKARNHLLAMAQNDVIVEDVFAAFYAYPLPHRP